MSESDEMGCKFLAFGGFSLPISRFEQFCHLFSKSLVVATLRFLTLPKALPICTLVSTRQLRVLRYLPPGWRPSFKRDMKMAKLKFRPLHDRVVVRRLESEEKSKGGIIIPDTAKEKPQEGEVVSVGTGARDDSGKIVALDVKAGDKILFGKWSGTEVKLAGVDYLIMKESDIMGIIG